MNVRNLVRSLEDLWFDSTRGVKTSGAAYLTDLTITGNPSGSYPYLPVRAANARAALRRLPIRNYSEYTFIDLGSGRGRMLLIAGELPFSKVTGVEFAQELHDLANDNIRRARHMRRRCRDIESINTDALDYVFPRQKLVVFMYNPFGPESFRKVIHNLDASLGNCPRDTFLIMLDPEPEATLDTTRHMRPYYQTRRFQIYRSITELSGSSSAPT